MGKHGGRIKESILKARLLSFQFWKDPDAIPGSLDPLSGEWDKLLQHPWFEVLILVCGEPWLCRAAGFWP